MALINSKKKQISQGEIIVHAVMDAGFTGQAAAIEMSKVVAELDQPNCYGITIGNTLFISHSNEKRTDVFLRVINVDTHKNLINNIEIYVRRAKSSGVKTIVYADPDSSTVTLMDHIKKLHLAIVQVERSKETGWYVFVLTFPEDMKQQNQANQAQQEDQQTDPEQQIEQ